ncbi:MAG: hypothetical protein KBT03_12085 [Bacteroidales bacterium]|nr:hypothetical protein [Candidatus Scybalousia scybalohippi]
MAFKPGDKFIIEIKEVTNDGFLFHGIPKRIQYHQLLNLTQVEERHVGETGIKNHAIKTYKEVIK